MSILLEGGLVYYDYSLIWKGVRHICVLGKGIRNLVLENLASTLKNVIFETYGTCCFCNLAASCMDIVKTVIPLD